MGAFRSHRLDFRIVGTVISPNLVESLAFHMSPVCMYFEQPDVMVAQKNS